jgi:hypothetical protein
MEKDTPFTAYTYRPKRAKNPASRLKRLYRLETVMTGMGVSILEAGGKEKGPLCKHVDFSLIYGRIIILCILLRSKHESTTAKW